MSDLFRLTGAVKHDPAIEAWFFDLSGELRLMARPWFERMRSRGADVRELMHDGCPTACVGDAAFAYVGAYKAHVNVGFFHGATLKDPTRLLEGSGKRMRHVKLRPDQTINTDALNDLIAAAYDDVRKRLATEG